MGADIVPSFSNITPTDNSFTSGAVSYTLNTTLKSGQIKWQIVSGGTSRGGISPIQALATNFSYSSEWNIPSWKKY